MATMNFSAQPNVNNSSMVLAAQPSEIGVREMSSLEIAELTGKQHSHVMRDIRTLVDNLKKSNESTSGLVDFNKDYHRGDRTQYKYLSPDTQNAILDFAFDKNSSPYVVEESSYIDEKGEPRNMYKLNKKASLLLASGYNVALRAKIIDRWEALETGQETPIYQKIEQAQSSKPQQANSLKEHIEAFGIWMQMTGDVLKLDDYSKFLMIKTEGERLSLPIPPAPKSDGPVDSVTNLLKSNDVMNNRKPMSAVAFNKILIERGYMREIPRINSKGKNDPYKSLTDKGIKFGINRWSENSTSPTTQPYFYIDKFPELLKEIGLN